MNCFDQPLAGPGTAATQRIAPPSTGTTEAPHVTLSRVPAGALTAHAERGTGTKLLPVARALGALLEYMSGAVSMTVWAQHQSVTRRRQMSSESLSSAIRYLP